ncbi:hypothetical protein K503DRAFT_701652 [Rhizopogon vinicolor AM-OR11-026]|uniref:DRBM domain-containing protein n=1 Tax=Rhizopogon vinicolor AM-OR11-026 TaxID=1314800 RepID=A0A1B7MJC2_9AGAM|nr:hypothetical protein K503DRAFT_701652 [Rhizopogon vinicolor AM-OR11-026]
MADYRMELNNLLQRRYGASAANHFRWESFRTGTDHFPTWTFIAYVDGIEYGRGCGRDQGTAKEIAAEGALSQLRRQWGHLF